VASKKIGAVYMSDKSKSEIIREYKLTFTALNRWIRQPVNSGRLKQRED